MMYNPNSNVQPNIVQEKGLKGIKIALIILDLFRGIVGGFLSLLLMIINTTFDFISGLHYLLAIIAAILLFLSLPKQRWGAGISIFAFGIDMIIGIIFGNTAILPYLFDIAVIILAIIFLTKSKNVPITQGAPTTMYPTGQYTASPPPNTYTSYAGSPNVSGTPSPSGKMCPFCGIIQSQADAKFCSSCGRRLE